MLPHLPNELIILIFETMDTKKLLHVRLTTRKFKALADVVLADRFSKPTWLLSQTTKTLKSAFTELNDTQRPYMDHYSQFLVNLPSTDVTEATWYTAPPQELQTVCECLCILRGAVPVPANATPASLAGPQRIAMSWPAIKRIMGRYDFKTWFVGLDKTAKTIDAANVRRVEDIIRMDPLITYERLRDVSQAGYKLLIVVAACLQFGNIYNQIETRRAELVSFERKFDRSTRFLAAVGGSQTAFMLKPAPLAASASSATLSDASDSSDNADTRSLSSSASSETLTDLSDD
ncbi:hypothetical protein BC831DRAFT_400104 [Entophlyctis helioformis]|nr:hypothetical protein BC831DRAFT_400104 [Entophlyctis helioformis]